MADTALQVVVSPFLGLVFENLTSLIQNKFGLVWGVQKELEKLSSTLSTIQAVLDDAQEKQLTNKAITNWLHKLTEMAYEADDVLDECACEGLVLESEMITNSCMNQVTDCLKQVKFRYKIGNRVREIRERFDEIAQERIKFHLREGVVERRVGLSYFRETGSMLTEPQVYGRDQDKENLVILLLNNVDSHSVCPILGIGGLGKTTLAQMVYNDERVAEHFEARSWVSVSDDFDVKRLIKAVIVSISGRACDLEELDPLQRRLQEEVRGKRCLLVLDDVWNENQDEWNKLKGSFGCGVKGSSVLVTTRLETVSSITGTVPAYRLKVLSGDDCWSLFKERAFGLGNEERPILSEIGKEIVKKCGGVPLAAKALGGLLRFNCEEEKWLSVRNSEIWDLPQSNENNILPALRLSYDHLPSHMRQCFAYCSIYPKDYTIRRKELILLWMANGLVQSNGEMELEDVANEIFNALTWRSFFQDIKKNKRDYVKTCKMHDLVHDLACHIAVDECSALDVGKADYTIRRTRHLSLAFRTGPSYPHEIESILKLSPCLRSLIRLGNFRPFLDPSFIFSNLIGLRALDLTWSPVSVLPNSIGKLKHLRYLDLSGNDITSLPESICRARKLQTLKLHYCHELRALPRNMRKMRSLRHLGIRGCKRLSKMPVGIGQLTSLQTLRTFIVGSGSGRGIKELQGLNLGGTLEIERLENVQNSMDANEALIRKKNLRFLRLSWSNSHIKENSVEVLEALQPHSNLTRLSIQRYDGVTFPSWLTVSSLPNLIEVFLSQCRRCEHPPPLAKLPLLKVLKLYSMDSVKFIDDEVHNGSLVKGFPSLEELELHWTCNLEGWTPHQGGEVALFPCLNSLILEECPKLKGITLPQSLKKVRMTKCNEMVLGSLHNLPFLSSLAITKFEELRYTQEQMLRNLTSLQELEITNCRQLISLPKGMRNLSSLKVLMIGDCDGLKSLPELELSSLDVLNISSCQNLEFSTEDFKHLTSLRRLTLWGLPKLKCLPEGTKYSSCLQDLTIRWCCSDVMDLPDWIGTLTSLQILVIQGCKNRKVLPEGMQHLTALRLLEIKGCNPDLERECEKEKGREWSKISHVQVVEIRSS